MTIAQFASTLARQKDIFLITVFALVLLMMIVPLPAFLMDVLITLNISASIIILLISLQLHNPVQFSTFPSVLLVTTLFRLAISVSTTRLILIEGDAGEIVATFGAVVVGGNLVVGLVIFLIITVVQFIVITKGADRVAEVGARFTLDGLPGKQMSVDADVRAGNIDQADAKETRETLEREAKLFGSMDGAMKFVKGDAIASLVITAINLLGGVAIGMVQRSMSFGDSLKLYALLTVGDGLIAQIPALLISVAAGNIVTRVTNPRGMDLGTEISQQMLANGRTIIIAGVVIAVFGVIPGFPTAIFVAIGGAMSGGVFWTYRMLANRALATETSWDRKLESLERKFAEIEQRTKAMETIKLVLPSGIREIDVSWFCQMLDNVRAGPEAEFGVPLGYWRIAIEDNQADTYRVFVRQELVATGQLRPGTVFVKANPSYLEALEIPSAADFGPREGTIVDSRSIVRLKEEGIEYWTPEEQLFIHLKMVVIEHLDSIAGFQNTVDIINETRQSNPVLIADLREALSNNQIIAVLRMLLRERIPISSRVQIFEALLQWSQERDATSLLQKVRISLAEFLTKRFAPDGFLPVVVVAPTLEANLREGMRITEEGRFLVLEPSISANIAKQARDIASDGFRRGYHPVLMTQQDVRHALFNVLRKHGVYVPVLAYQEIVPETIIYAVSYLSADPEDAQ
ncbi:type III secretion protein V [Bradyrhizobium sp. USDA 4524]|uniref:flagellar biosynthesis protein FlhA n=1 Tax=unclassified Bradyrhizobium TaxID=2631580 RepID=UPI0020A11BC3|nr:MULTISPECIES: flagellar biosynthesis protein FlhA [unclassified Bradyrhizobium]MCP1846118.1 type III secretion protein V [Bradyrhizobium sp. USDA 4538]MCP1907247.1 type III secretion protein V [Bradyrhizobium sp. USDA 4537]MCP1985723.1 type III secretion protein V [Bradyrhizobium sp. USDA 4539]